MENFKKRLASHVMDKDAKVQAILAIASGKRIEDVVPINDILIIGRGEGKRLLVLCEHLKKSIDECDLEKTVMEIRRRYKDKYIQITNFTHAEYDAIDAQLEANC